MNVAVPDDALNLALHKAIIEALGAEGRDKIIALAIAHLTTDQKKDFGDRQPIPSPIKELVFREAAAVARTIISGQLQNDADFQAQIHEVYTAAIRRVLGTENRERLVTRIADAFETAFTKDRY